jgi:hypothetical protein
MSLNEYYTNEQYGSGRPNQSSQNPFLCGVFGTSLLATLRQLPGQRLRTKAGFHMATSKLQEQVKQRLRILLSDYHCQENARPDWLRNPGTGYPLELDFWLPDLKVGIEVQGRQHLEYIPHFHDSIKGFEKQLQHDEIKRQTCKEIGVFFYEVFELHDIDVFIEASQDHCVEMAQQLYRKVTAIKAISYYAAEMVRERTRKRPNQEKMNKLLKGIKRIQERYNVPVDAIEPDFSITNLEMAFNGKPIVKVLLQTPEGNPVKQQDAVIVNWEDGPALVRWFSDKKGEQYQEGLFDLDTCQPVEMIPHSHDFIWVLIPETVPEKLGHFLDPKERWHMPPTRQRRCGAF